MKKEEEERRESRRMQRMTPEIHSGEQMELRGTDTGDRTRDQSRGGWQAYYERRKRGRKRERRRMAGAGKRESK